MLSLLVLLLFASLLANVEAGIFIKAKQPNILQDAVWLYSNASAITSFAQDVPGNKFSSHVYPFNNVPEPHDSSAVGILYNRDDACTSQVVQSIPYPFYTDDPKAAKVPKIALIKIQGNCTITTKLLNAQADGAIGAIIYTDQDITDVQDKADGVLPDHGIEIPAYYVDHTVGEELLFQLKKMAGVPTAKISTFDNSNLTTRISVRVALMPADDVKPTAWELTLLVVLVILGTSIIFSVVTHIYLMKRNRRLHQSVERNRGQGNSRLQAKSLISYARLYQFPTRTIDTLPSEKEQKVIESVINEQQQKQQKSLFGISLFKKKILTTLTMEHPVNHMCVVCLEAFKIGDQVRKLPCNHEYHCLCIDPWLTSKSSECPLCKFDCSDPKTKDQVVDPDGLIAAAAVPGLKGKFVRLYRSIKSKARRHQVNPSTGMHDAAEYEAAPPSPGLRAAVMAIESMENQQAPHLPTEQAQNVDTTLADDRKSSQQEPPVVEGQSSAPQQGNHNAVQGAENNNASNKRTSQHAQNNEQKDHVQNSQAEHRDTDVASLSLCSIDLGGLDFDINK